jgi:hypothetical protein
VDRELRAPRYHRVPHGQRQGTHRKSHDGLAPGLELTAASPQSCASPLPGAQTHGSGMGAADGAGPPAGQPAGEPVPMLFTPAQAADTLRVPESWLRRRAARRLVPCTLLGKHLRFSRADLDQIVAEAGRPMATDEHRIPGASGMSRRRGRPRGPVRAPSH